MKRISISLFFLLFLFPTVCLCALVRLRQITPPPEARTAARAINAFAFNMHYPPDVHASIIGAIQISETSWKVYSPSAVPFTKPGSP